MRQPFDRLCRHAHTHTHATRSVVCANHPTAVTVTVTTGDNNNMTIIDGIVLHKLSCVHNSHLYNRSQNKSAATSHPTPSPAAIRRRHRHNHSRIGGAGGPRARGRGGCARGPGATRGGSAAQLPRDSPTSRVPARRPNSFPAPPTWVPNQVAFNTSLRLFKCSNIGGAG